jgi:MFS family permease
MVDVPAVTFRQVLGNRNFLRLWIAQLVSQLGDWLALLALFSLVAFRRHGSPADVSGILVAFILPFALLGPAAGVLVDRWNPKATMIASDLLRAALAVLLALAASLPQLYALVFGLSAVSAFFIPAQTVTIPLIVGKEELLVANALSAQTMHLTKVVGPAAAGVLVAAVGEKACFLIDAATFLFSAAVLAGLTVHRESRVTTATRSLLAELTQGLRFVASRPPIVFVIVTTVAAIVAAGVFDALIAVYVRDTLSAGSRAFGALVSVVGAGTIAGAFIVGRFGQGVSRVRLVAFGTVGAGVAILGIAVSTRLEPALVASLGLGLAAAAVFIPSQTLLQEETPPALLGRVSATFTTTITVAQLVGILGAGRLAQLAGIRRLYCGVAAIIFAVGVAGYAWARGWRPAAARPAETAS